MEKAIRVAYGEAVSHLAKVNNKVVVLDADLSNATQTKIFKKEFPERFFNVGIAEENLIGIASGFAYSGLIPFASTFAMFGAGRGFEIIRNQVAYGNLNVKLAFTHAGISVGEDGGSHQSIEDIALMRVLPNMTVIVPSDAIETEKAIFAAAEMKGPVYLRLARPVSEIITKESDKFEIGKANVMCEGEDVCIFACGLMVPFAINSSKLLAKENISVAVINVHTIKPLDTDLVLKYAKKCKLVVAVEEHSIIGGLGSAIAETIVGKTNCKFAQIGLNDCFGHSGDVDGLFKEFGLTPENIIKTVKNNLN